ncbi:hypothetical protein MTR_4g036800 [Medicago truncatula]|uniref:Uncharacterized protein n=1 Tax=Medicago truncatula TaxID=3880 RepID=A0A072UI78_MEDTR|nr:hypothetical protein MTR_4g036800 [Medicago truncatula]
MTVRLSERVSEQSQKALELGRLSEPALGGQSKLCKMLLSTCLISVCTPKPTGT